MSLIFNVQKRHFAGYIKKRVTRLTSDVEITPQDVAADQQSPNDCPPSRLENRNPRNLEQLLFEVKPLGWELERTPKSFWNKIVFEAFRGHIDAKIIHNSGRLVLKASTAEDGIASQVGNPSSVAAAGYLGQVMARRCLESGILYVLNGLTTEQLGSAKSLAFLDGIQKYGLSLKEPLFIWPRRRRDL